MKCSIDPACFRGCAIALFLAWGPPAAWAQPGFEFSRAIDTPASDQEELISFALDAQVFAGADERLSDLRVLDSRGTEVAYLVRKVQTSEVGQERVVWSAAQISARPVGENGLEITLRLDNNDPPPQGLSIETQLKDFEHRVRVDSSPDGQNWTQLGPEHLIFDYSRFIDARNLGTPLPQTADRYFRVVIDDVTADQEQDLLELTRRLRGSEELERDEQTRIVRRPFRVERIVFWGMDERSRIVGDLKTEYPARMTRVRQNDGAKQTEIAIEANGAPLTEIRLKTSTRNFSRQATVQAHDANLPAAVRQIGQALVSKIDFQSLRQEQMSIEFPESRQRSYTVLIENRDSPPLEIDGVVAYGNTYEVVFLAAPGMAYQIAYGRPGAAAPNYDSATIDRLLAEGFQPVAGELGPVVQAAVLPPTRRIAEWFSQPWLLFLAGAVLVAFLAWGLYNAARRLDGATNERR
jgi:hypothetical protein